MLKSFYRFINESYPEELSDKVDDLNTLLQMDLISPKEYVKEFGEQPFYLLPNAPFLDIINGETHSSMWDREWMERWRGPGGERIVIADGTETGYRFYFRFTLSSGAVVTANWIQGEEDMAYWKELSIGTSTGFYKEDSENLLELDYEFIPHLADRRLEDYYGDALTNLINHSLK